MPPIESLAPPLLRRFPELAGELPYLPLGRWPTPVQALRHLSRELHGEIWVKRDDLSGERYGGNKVRKLEFVLAEALAGQCRNLLGVGGIGSNQLIATAVYANTLGLKTHGLVFPQPVTDHVHENLRLMSALRVRLHTCRNRPLVPLALSLLSSKLAAPYVLAPGASSPLGNLGFVAAALELREQIDAGQLPEPDAIFVPLGSGGTVAGLVLGCQLAGLRARIFGVRVVERWLMNRTVLGVLLRRTAALLRRHGVAVPRPSQGRLELVGGFLGRRYGEATQRAIEAVVRAEQREGLRLETTYSGKAFAALLDFAAGPGRGRRLLFWNTFNSRDTRPLLLTGKPRALPERVRQWIEPSS